MSRKKQSKVDSKITTSWLKPWTKIKNPPIIPDDPPDKEKKLISTKSPAKPIKSLPNATTSKKTINSAQKPTIDRNYSSAGGILPTTDAKKTPNSPIKPRSLGMRQLASQPISVPIKHTLDLMKDVMYKIKGSSTAPDKIEPPIHEEPTVPPAPQTGVPLKSVPGTPAAARTEAPLKVEPVIHPVDQIRKEHSDSSKVDLIPHSGDAHSPKEQSLPPISDTLADIRHIKIWSLDSESFDYSGKSTEELFVEAMSLYQLGLSGDKEAVPQAFRLLINVLQNDRQNLLAEAYLGSVISLMGRDAQDANDRFKFVIKGLKILDKVVSLSPEHVEIRGMRAFVCAKLPEQFFHRSVTAIEDFSYLVLRYEEDETLFPKEFYHQILFELALAYHRLDKKSEAESTCHKLLSLTSDSKYKMLIKQAGILHSDLPHWQRKAEQRSGIKNSWSKLKYDERVQEGMVLHNRAIADDQYALEKAFNIFKQAHKQTPQDPLIKAYYADCLSLLGLNAPDTAIMFRHANHAIKLLDQAVNSCHEDITLRFLRGYNSYRIPEAFFRRTLTAIHDFEYILQRFEEDPSLLPEETYWQILYDLGDAYERLEMTEEAHKTWRKLSQCGDTPYQDSVKESLNLSPESPPDLGSYQSPEDLLQEGLRLHEQSITGNKNIRVKAYQVLLKAHEADITNPMAQGYLGSSMAIYGQSSTDPSEIYHYFFKGMDHLKKAIANDPNNYTLHLLLAQVMYHYSPNFFRGNEKIIKEFKFLKLAYERDNSIFPEENYLEILYDLGACYQRSGDSEKAKKCWERLSKLTINPKYSKWAEESQEGETDMDKDSIRDKFKEIAEDIAEERAKEKAKEKKVRKERKHSEKTSQEKSAEKPEEKPRRKRKEREKESAAPISTETTGRKRKRDREKEEAAPVATETGKRKHRKNRDNEKTAPAVINPPVKLTPEEKKARREEKEKSRAAALEKAMNRAKRAKKDEAPPAKPVE